MPIPTGRRAENRAKVPIYDFCVIFEYVPMAEVLEKLCAGAVGTGSYTLDYRINVCYNIESALPRESVGRGALFERK